MSMSLLNKIKTLIKPILKVEETNESVSKTTSKESYTGVPAPVVLDSDPWFGDATKSERQLAHEEECEQLNADQHDGWWLRDSMDETLWNADGSRRVNEPHDIHERLYRVATQHGKNTWQENLGGSENFQEPNDVSGRGWNSGTGLRQFE